MLRTRLWGQQTISRRTTLAASRRRTMRAACERAWKDSLNQSTDSTATTLVSLEQGLDALVDLRGKDDLLLLVPRIESNGESSLVRGPLTPSLPRSLSSLSRRPLPLHPLTPAGSLRTHKLTTLCHFCHPVPFSPVSTLPLSLSFLFFFSPPHETCELTFQRRKALTQTDMAPPRSQHCHKLLNYHRDKWYEKRSTVEGLTEYHKPAQRLAPRYTSASTSGQYQHSVRTGMRIVSMTDSRNTYLVIVRHGGWK